MSIKYKISIGDDIMENTIRVNFNLDKDTHFQVKQLALNKHTTATELYRKWISDGMKRDGNQTKADEL